MAFNELFKIIGVGIVTLVCYIIIKPIKPEIAVFISLIGSCVILVFCIDNLYLVIESITSIVNKTGISNDVFKFILKVIGIGYLCEFASNICIDAGNNSIADKILLAGKICITIMSLPILTSLFNLVLGLLP